MRLVGGSSISQRIGAFALIALPNATVAETKTLADDVARTGWVAREAGFLAVKIGSRLVFANFSDANRRLGAALTNAIPARRCGWIHRE